MKICFITSFYPGATIPLVEHMQERGHQCDLYFLFRQGTKGMETVTLDKEVKGSDISQISKNNTIYRYLDDNINFNVVPYYIVRNRKYLIGYIPFFRNQIILNKMLKDIERKDYDIFYIIANEENDAIIARQLKRKGYNNVVIAYHEVVTTHTGHQELKSVVKSTSRLGYPLICYSEHTKRILKKFLNNDNVYVTYFGPFETYKLFDTSKPIIQEPYILFIGSIQPYKGLPFLYESIRDYGQTLNTKIVIAGSGYDSCLKEMNKDDRYIIMNHFLSDAEFANLTRYASCIVCPYVSGSQSGITHTAMVYGTHVVATKVGAFSEFIEDGKNGYLVEYGNKQQLITSICKTLRHKAEFGDFIPEKLRWSNIANELELIINGNVQ